MEEPIIGLPSQEAKNKLSELGISEMRTTPFGFYEIMKGIPKDKRKDFKMLLSCTGGNERSRIIGNVAHEMGFDVASILKPNPSYHKKYAVPVGELVDPADEATFPGGNIQFHDFLDKPVNYIVVFSNDIIDPTGKVEVADRYTDRMINAISEGLYKASKESGEQPHGITLIRVPTIEREAQQIGRLFEAEKDEIM